MTSSSPIPSWTFGRSRTGTLLETTLHPFLYLLISDQFLALPI